MAWYDNAITKLGKTIAGFMVPDGYEKRAESDRNYYLGDHPKQLRVKSGQYDDNITLNYVGLAINRSVSRLFNGGVEFVLPDGATRQQEILDNIWDTNNEESLLYQFGLNGAVYGTPYIKIIPDGITNRYTGVQVPRLITLDPEITTIEVNPFDVDEVLRYVVEFTIERTSYREVTRQVNENDLVDPMPGTWIIEHFILTHGGDGKWHPDPDRPPVHFPYDFPPIIHCKNLPSLKAQKGCYGTPDSEWALNLQDKLNFAYSNIGKTIRLNAAPPTIVTGSREEPNMKSGPGSLSWFMNPDTKVYNLQANADIVGSRAFGSDLQSSVFELMREVPPSVIQQLGSGLTNFVMRVVYSDTIEKNDTKRELYGDALLELNRRLLVMQGFEGEASQPGQITWGDALPSNPQEEILRDQFLLNSGLVSKKTMAEKYKLNYDDEVANMNAEKQNENALGGNLLRDFIAGRTDRNATA